MDNQTVEGVADRDTARLGIMDNGHSNLQRTKLIEIGVDYTGTRFNYRHLGGVANELYQFLAATRDAYINIAHGIEHLAGSLVGSWKQFHNGRIHAFAFQNLMNEGDDGTIRVIGISSALQHAGIAALEAKGKHVERHIRTGFVNNADNTERYGNTSQHQTVFECPVLQDLTQRILQSGHVAHVGGYSFQTGIGQLQTVVEWIRLLHACQVLGIFPEQHVLLCDNSICHLQQDGVFPLIADQRQFFAGSLYALKCFFQLHFRCSYFIKSLLFQFAKVRIKTEKLTFRSRFFTSASNPFTKYEL